MRKQLHPGAKWLFRLRGYLGAFVFLLFAGWFIFGILGALSVAILGKSIEAMIGIVIFLILAYIMAIIIIAEIYARMSYARWFYEFTNSNLKTERGIIWKRYSNVPYERVQNVDITRGVIARICGFSSVNIQTAGFSYGGGAKGLGAEGYIPAVDIDEAEQIRDYLMKKIGKRQGL